MARVPLSVWRQILLSSVLWLACSSRAPEVEPRDPSASEQAPSSEPPAGPGDEAAEPSPTTVPLTGELDSFRSGRRRLPWPGPFCFAHDPEHGSYACLSASVESDEIDFDAPTPRPPPWWAALRPAPYEGFVPMSPERWVPPASREVAWGLEAAVDVLGDPDLRAASLMHRAYGSDAPVARPRTERELVRMLEARGYRTPVTESTTLPPGRWVSFHGVSLRFTTRWHTGSASEYAVATLEMRCREGRGPEVDLIPDAEALQGHRGSFAAAFAAPDAPAFVVGLVLEGGGEGSGYFRTQNRLVSVHDRCDDR